MIRYEIQIFLSCFNFNLRVEISMNCEIWKEKVNEQNTCYCMKLSKCFRIVNRLVHGTVSLMRCRKSFEKFQKRRNKMPVKITEILLPNKT